MTVVPPKSKIINSQNGPIFTGPSDKEIADLQVKKAGLQNEIDTFIKDLKILHVQKKEIEQKIGTEQKLYDSMVLQTTAEMQAELEKKVVEHQATLQELNKKLESIILEIQNQDSLRDSLHFEIHELEIDIEKKKIQFAEEIKISQNVLTDIKNQVEKVKNELNLVLADTHRSKIEAEHAHTDMIAYRQQQQDHAAFLERKNRDLTIWERRLTPKFQEQHPGEEMKFV